MRALLNYKRRCQSAKYIKPASLTRQNGWAEMILRRIRPMNFRAMRALVSFESAACVFDFVYV